MSAFILTVVIIYSLGILANLYNMSVAAKKGEPLGVMVFGIVTSIVFVVWGIALLAR